MLNSPQPGSSRAGCCSQCSRSFDRKATIFVAVPVVHAEGPHRAALGVGAAQVVAVGEGRGRLARLHVDEAEVRVAGRVGLVVLADVLEAVEPVPEDDGGRLHHVQVERAQLADLGTMWFATQGCAICGQQQQGAEEGKSLSFQKLIHDLAFSCCSSARLLVSSHLPTKPSDLRRPP